VKIFVEEVLQLLLLLRIKQKISYRVRNRMDVGVLGISYRSSELELREKFAKVCQTWSAQENSPPVVILSTCNRTEIYFSAPSLIQMYEHILDFLRKTLGSWVQERVYAYFEARCFLHLASVCSGVDSIIFGEAEIQRQVKKAYEEAKQRLQLPFSLHFLFQKTLKVGKEIRTEFSLPRGALSIQSTIGKLFELFFTKEKKVSILLVGYSTMNRNILHFFRNKKGVCISIATKNAYLEEEVDLLPWSQLEEWPRFDMVISASKTAEPILKVEALSKDPAFIKTRLVLDLGLPRNIDPKVGKHPLISLLNIEEIGNLLDQRRGVDLQTKAEVEETVKKLISIQVSIYRDRQQRMGLCIS
jgi:glutamyl-tRNA reductase